MPALPTYQELLAIAKERATPIDFAALEATGAVRRGRGDWWLIVDGSKLPGDVLRKAAAIKTSKRGTFIKFQKPSLRIRRYLLALDSAKSRALQAGPA